VATEAVAQEGTATRLRVTAVPIGAWLTAIVVASILVRYLLARRIVAPWIMVDELIYSELARGVVSGEGFTIRGSAAPAYSFVYPLLIAPAYLIDALPTAYQVVKAINAVLVSLAAVPAYFLARRVLGCGLSVFAAALAVSIPSLVFAGEVMTENAFYPLFLCVALAMVLALERPTLRRQGVLLALCAIACLTRVQAVALIPAVLLAPFLLGTWRAWRATYAFVAAVGAALLSLQWARGQSPLDLLGAYATTGEQRYDVAEVARWLLYHVADLDLYLGVFPFAAALVVFSLWPRLPELRPYLAATAAIAVCLLLEVSFFATIPSVQRIQERNLFYLAPLLLIAFLVWIDQGAPRPTFRAVAAALLAAALPAFIPYERLIGVSAQSDTLMLLPLWRIQERWFALDDVVFLACAASAAAALAFLLVSRPHAIFLALALVPFYVALQRPVTERMERAAAGALAEGIHQQRRDWIDALVGDRGEVGALWTGNASRFPIWQNEMFNRSVGPVFYVGQPMEGGLPSTPLTLDRGTGALRPAADIPFMLADSSVEFVGTVIGADTSSHVTLWALDPPLRQASLVEGVYADTWSSGRVTYTRFGCDGGSVTASVQGDPSLRRAPSTVRVVGTDVRVAVPADGRPHTVVAPLRRVDGQCTATFDVSPTTVAGPSDPRELGLHFDPLRYTP